MTRLFRMGMLVLIVCLALPAFAQDCDEPSDPAKMMEAQQKTMMLMGPGPEHELLSKMEGEWEADVNVHMAPGADPMSSPMTSSAEWVLGGRFLEITSKGSLMGMDVESITMFGFDRRHELYTMIGYDTMGTYYITASGAYDEATNTIHYHGIDEDPVSGVTQDYSFALTFNEDGSYTMGLTFNCPTFGTGAPYKLMEYTSTKVTSGK